MTYVDEKSFYKNDSTDERTRKRLIEMSEIGMEICGHAQWGVPGIMSGLYIEYVWNYSEEDFNDYLDWVKSLIEREKNKQG